jgi:hypothetical protein
LRDSGRMLLWPRNIYLYSTSVRRRHNVAHRLRARRNEPRMLQRVKLGEIAARGTFGGAAWS